jgi:hypothetical protein
MEIPKPSWTHATWNKLANATFLAYEQPSPENLAAFRAALLALDREVTGGKLPPLVSWQEAMPRDQVFLEQREGLACLVENYSGKRFVRYVQGRDERNIFVDDEFSGRVVAYLTLRAEDALPVPRKPVAVKTLFGCSIATCNWSGHDSDRTCPACHEVREPIALSGEGWHLGTKEEAQALVLTPEQVAYGRALAAQPGPDYKRIAGAVLDFGSAYDTYGTQPDKLAPWLDCLRASIEGRPDPHPSLAIPPEDLARTDAEDNSDEPWISAESEEG